MDSTNSSIVYRLKFPYPYPKKRTIEAIFDTCIWFSRAFSESSHSNPIKKEQGKVAEALIQEYSPPEFYLSILDTVNLEFMRIVHDKGNEFLKTINILLREAKKRSKDGENDKDIINEFTKQIKDDSHINSFYHYFEQKEMNFSQIYIDENLRIEFLDEFWKLPLIMQDQFNILTLNFPRRYVNESIALWAKRNKEDYKYFLSKSTKIGKYDRYHLLGCIIICLCKKRSINFLTFDKLLSEKAEQVLDFLLNNKSKLELQFMEIYPSHTLSDNTER